MRTAILLVAVSLLWACGESGAEATSSATDATTEVAEPTPLWKPEGDCATPAALPPDPLVLASRSPYKKAHLQDVDYDEARGLIFTSGLPGLLVYQDVGQDSGGPPQFIARFPPEAQNGSKKNNRDYQHLEVVDETLVAATNRGNKHAGRMGVHLIDVTDVNQMGQWPKVTIPSAAGLVSNGPRLYVLSHDGAVYLVDLDDLDRAHESPSLVVEGLGNPWNITLDGDRAYVADNSLGVVTLDVSAPDAPTLVGITKTQGGPQDIVAHGGLLFVASGSKGVELFDLADPDAPESLSTVDIGGPVISVSVDGGILATADHAGVGLVDVTEPSLPTPLAFEATPSWAMHVHMKGSRVLLADWNALSIFDHVPGAGAPEARLNRDEVYLVGEETVADFEIANQGSAPLFISGVSVEDARVEVGFDQLEVAPGETALAQVSVEQPVTDLSTTLCLATNDPDQPLMEVAIASSSSASSVTIGDPAPDFTLQDLDGNYHTLSKELGKPILLCYFATW